MKRFKVENLCTFDVEYREGAWHGELYKIVVRLRLKKIKNNNEIILRMKKILNNKWIMSIKPRNKRAIRLMEKARKKEKRRIYPQRSTDISYGTVSTGSSSVTSAAIGGSIYHYWRSYQT